MSAELIYGICCNCGAPAAACPYCINSLPIDPATGLPPDVTADGTPQEPTQEATERSPKQPLCDDCITRKNRYYPHLYTETAEERHARGFCLSAQQT